MTASPSSEIPVPPPPGAVTYAIGDVHGCLAKVVALIERCRHHCDGRTSRLVFVGDYIDRGPDSRGVIELLMTAQRERPDQVICLRGNHEAMMLAAVRTGDDVLWLLNGAS